MVEAFVDDSITRSSVTKQVLGRMPDFHRISNKFHRRKADLMDIVRVYQAILLASISLSFGSDKSHHTAAQITGIVRKYQWGAASWEGDH
jgi:DNA mismatch repair ATPase MutS